MFEPVHGCQYFSVLDLRQAYHHIRIAETDQPKTAFSFEGKKYEWSRLPFGLQGGAFSLASTMTHVLEKHKAFCAHYYDDIIIFSRNQEEHLRHLNCVLQTLSEYGLCVNFSKCQLLLTQVQFLGHRLNGDGIRPSQKNIDDIVSILVSMNTKQLHSFLGMCAFFQKFIPKFSEKYACLFQMLMKNMPFVWTQECNECFHYIKSELCSDKLLLFPDFNKPFILQTDASEKAIG